MLFFWLGILLLCTGSLVVGIIALYMHGRVMWLYVPRLCRIFQEKPLFIIPRGQPAEGAEAVRFTTEDGKSLNGCYLKARGRRRGVILFGLEFGSNCWSCRSYCDHLIEAGFDVFAFESRNQGDSDQQPGYEPLQWVTDFEVTDTRAAIAYLKARPDADPDGIGFFGISKGAGAGLIAASGDQYVRCFVTDGMFGTETTLVPYMRKWFRIYNGSFPPELIPEWYLHIVGRVGMRRIERGRGCRFPSLEAAMARLSPRPVLMIHGEDDTYIKADMAKALFANLGEPRELWMVPGAKHNQPLHVAGDEYRGRVVRFFERYLADEPEPARATADDEGTTKRTDSDPAVRASGGVVSQT